MAQQITKSSAQPLMGGIDLVHEKGLIPTGGFTSLQNLRPRNPGFEKRKGCARNHTTAADSQEIISPFNFSKSGRAENHLFAQMADGSIREATTIPPGVTTGNFGSTVLAARSGASPATWSVFNDFLVICDGAGLPVVYPGQVQPVQGFVVHKGTAAIPDIPIEGSDFTEEVTDGRSATYATLSSLNTLANFHAVYIITPVRANKLTWTVVNANGTVSTATLKYRKNDGTWAAVSGLSDGTAVGGATLGQSGDMTWTLPTDEIPHYAFGYSGYCYELSVSVQLDSSVTVSAVTFEGPFQEMENVWDGELVPSPEVKTYINSNTSYNTYASDQVKPGGLTSSDKIYVSSVDLLLGLYLKVGKTPNTTAATAISSIKVWTDSGWSSALSNVKDGTNGGKQDGFITWQRNANARKLNFKSSFVYGYWYEITFSNTLSATLTWDIRTLPYFDINVLGAKAQSCQMWNGRMVYCFEDQFLHFAKRHTLGCLNGDDYGIIDPGDGRRNKSLAQKRFYQQLFAWSEEKGEIGGTFAMIQGDAPPFAKLTYSDKIGVLNSKSVIILEDVDVSEISPERPVFKGMFWLSRAGVMKSEGRIVKNISGGISNYFDPLKTECIRRGYESKHWMGWDNDYKLILIGLVSGSSATMPNVFFAYEPISSTYINDVRPYPISCIAGCDASTGTSPVVMVGGGQDGYVLNLNTKDNENDIDKAVHWELITEVNGNGHRIQMASERGRVKAQTSGVFNRLIARGGNSTFENRRTIPQTAANAGDTFRRFDDNIRGPGNNDEHFSYKLTNQFDVTSVTRSGTTATATIPVHGLTTGDSVYFAGSDQSEYNGIVTVTVATADTVTFTVSGSPATPATGTITATLAGVSAYLLDLGLEVESIGVKGDK